MTRFLLKLITFLSPLLIASFILLSKPLDASTFRIWEAVTVMRSNFLLPGPFYPRVSMEKVEGSELTLRDQSAQKKGVVWHTDEYGYRKNVISGIRYDIVIVGDSNVAGSGLSQNAMVSETLERTTGRVTYPLAPVSLNTFLSEKRFTRLQPQLVIVSNIERDLESLQPASARTAQKFHWTEQESVQEIAVLLDRFFYKKAAVRKWLAPKLDSSPIIQKNNQKVKFLQGAFANRVRSEKTLERVVSVVVSYRDALRERDINFVFMPIPNKESIYYGLIEGATKATFLNQLIEKLKLAGVNVVDLQSTYLRQNKADPEKLLYDPGDTHWNEHGVRIAVNELSVKLKEWAL